VAFLLRFDCERKNSEQKGKNLQAGHQLVFPRNRLDDLHPAVVAVGLVAGTPGTPSFPRFLRKGWETTRN
jgi:hypothetical protein